ncbi:hypothetical protein OJJOAM_002540 [Cupriavidus sp. H18C1]
MIFLRSLLFALYLLVLTPPYACACFLAFPFMSANRRYRFVRGWPKLVIGAAWLICGIRYRIEGGEHLQAMIDKPVVLLSKHQSAWETVALVATMPKPLCFVFKRELLFVPFFGWALGMLKMVHINRKDGSRAFASAVRQGRERLAEGAWIIMFPRRHPHPRRPGKPALQERRGTPGGRDRRVGDSDRGQLGPPVAAQLVPEVSRHHHDLHRPAAVVGPQDRRHAEPGSRAMDRARHAPHRSGELSARAACMKPARRAPEPADGQMELPLMDSGAGTSSTAGTRPAASALDGTTSAGPATAPWPAPPAQRAAAAARRASAPLHAEAFVPAHHRLRDR